MVWRFLVTGAELQSRQNADLSMDHLKKKRDHVHDESSIGHLPNPVALAAMQLTFSFLECCRYAELCFGISVSTKTFFRPSGDGALSGASSAGNPWVTATWLNFATANDCQVFGKRKRGWNAQAQKAGQQSCMDGVESTRRRSWGLWLDSFCPERALVREVHIASDWGGSGCILVPGRNRSTYHTHPQTISAGSLQFWSILYNCRESTGQVPASAINRTSWKGDVGSGVRAQRLMRSITIATQ